MTEFAYLLPEITLLLLILLVLFSKNKILCSLVSILVVIGTAIYSIFYHQNSYLFPQELFLINNFTQVAKLVILLFTLYIFIQLLVIDNKYDIDLPILMLFSTLGMLLTVSANNFLSLYIALEMQSLPSYVLAASDKTSVRSSEAGVKYFVLGALASGILLYGITLVYGFTGTVKFSELGNVTRVMGLSLGLFTGILFILVGLGFKLAAAPFHFWSPDVYHGAPPIITSFFAVVPKISLIAILSRILSGPFYNPSVTLIILVMAILSAVIGALGGLTQNNLKRLLAYSAITHVGYLLMFLASILNFKAINADNNIALLYITLYSVLNLGITALLLMMKEGELSEISGLAQKRPFIALCISILLFSMAGFPPFSGFFAKVVLLYEIIKNGFVELALIALVTTVIAAYYYLRIIKLMYFDKASNEELIAHPTLSYIIVGAAFTSIIMIPLYLFI